MNALRHFTMRNQDRVTVGRTLKRPDDFKLPSTHGASKETVWPHREFSPIPTGRGQARPEYPSFSADRFKFCPSPGEGQGRDFSSRHFDLELGDIGARLQHRSAGSDDLVVGGETIAASEAIHHRPLLVD